MSWCIQPDIGLPQPDLVVFLNIDVDKASKRQGYGEEKYERVEFQKKVLSRFEDLFVNDPTCKIIDATRSIEEIQSEIIQLVNETVSRVQDKPIDDLFSKFKK